MRVAGKVVGLRPAERLANLGGTSVQDLPLHIPSRYRDRTRLTPLRSWASGAKPLYKGTVTVAGLGFVARRTLVQP